MRRKQRGSETNVTIFCWGKYCNDSSVYYMDLVEDRRFYSPNMLRSILYLFDC